MQIHSYGDNLLKMSMPIFFWGPFACIVKAYFLEKIKKKIKYKMLPAEIFTLSILP